MQNALGEEASQAGSSLDFIDELRGFRENLHADRLIKAQGQDQIKQKLVGPDKPLDDQPLPTVAMGKENAVEEKVQEPIQTYQRKVSLIDDDSVSFVLSIKISLLDLF